MNSPDPDSLISVVVPSFNSDKTIGESIQSALDQTHSNIEILVADDGSTDATSSIVRERAAGDPRIRLLEGRHTGHPGAVRNRALHALRGEFLAFLDADDLWVRTKLAHQLAHMRARPGSDFCSTSTGFLAPNQAAPSLERAAPPTVSAPALQAIPESRRDGFELLLTRQRGIHTSSALMARSLLEKIGPFSEDPGLQSGQDDDFLFRAWRKGTPVALQEVYVFARRRPDSVSALNSWETVFELVARAEAREPLPHRLRRRAWSAAWVVRAERSLYQGNAQWRGPMVRAWSLDPFNPRRMPALLSAFLPKRSARRFYGKLRDRHGP